MSNLRLIIIKPIDSTTIKARFSESLSTLINTSNIIITSNVPGVPDPEVKSVSISDSIITISTQPMTPFASYFVTFKSTNSADFKSRNGKSFILEDGVTNSPLILGPEDPDNPVRNFLINLLKDNVYNLDTGSIVRTIINSQAEVLSRALYDIRQAKNDNYLQSVIIDERKVRGEGPFDRLNEEGAFQILRVGKKVTNTSKSGSQSFDSFPSSPITLQALTISEESLTAGTGASTFDGLILTVEKNFVTKLTGVEITYASDGSVFEYPISSFGYQVNDPRYDQDFASTLLTLENNQFGLSEQALDNSNFKIPVSGDSIIVSYEFKNKGRIIDEASVRVSQILDKIRESTPAISTEFSLTNAPIVNSNDEIVSSEGIDFLDPEANPPFSEVHPAFETELPFRMEGLPKNPGEYSVDYATGRVFVYGASINDGTGNFPPVATYKYRKSFRSELDYTYDPDFVELVANPSRDLIDQEVKISFDYEDTLIPDVDFNPQIHQEILDERIENRINSSNSISVKNTPITNVFRVFNETLGEIYGVTRFSNNKVYFNSVNPPRIFDSLRERSVFSDVFNETLIINREFDNILGTRIFEIFLNNSNIISATEDVIGSSYNSSATFSKTDIFETELYYDAQVLSQTSNTDRITEGQYQINYRDGTVFVGVTSDQSADIGTISYKKPTINPQNPHLVSVSEIYHSLSPLTGVDKRIELNSFFDGEISPQVFDVSDERFLNGDETLSYTVESGIITVQDNISSVRHIYDAYDLTNNISITNFAENATVLDNVITLGSDGILKQELSVVETGLVVSLPLVSTGAEISEVVSVLRTADNVEFFDSGTLISGFDITLSGVNSPAVGDAVLVTYRVVLNGAATPIVDYNRGDHYVDYTYLADEILVSYEFGDNVLDFRESDALESGEEYFVTYKVGALRDALLKNFGSLVDLPIINSFDTSIPRESYRDALKGALQSFTKGPTIPAIKSLVSNISHIEPEIIEAAFQVWSLGASYLYPNSISYTGDIQLLSGKFDTGALITNSDETISFPVCSNLRLEEGTLEMWVIPDWAGLDNDATLTFQVSKNNVTLEASKIFIGADSHNPIYDLNNKFTVSRFDDSSAIGLPSKVYTDTGFFIYYNDEDKRWNCLARDTLDGYVYSGNITSSGEVYDVKFIPGLGEINDILRSRINSIEFSFNLDSLDADSPDGYVDGYNIVDGYTPGDGYVAGYSFDGITFMADNSHYLFDFGEASDKNRFSLFKDGRGYLNFRVYDRGNSTTGRTNQFKVSADISDWEAGQKHHVAISWKLNTSDKRDEMHLFLDGEEVPNILKYGGRPTASSSDRFRTVKPESVVGTISLPIVNGNDLVTVAGSDTVTSSSINFENEGILPGHTINIQESGFGEFSIVGVADSSLILASTMPSTFSDAKFSVNEFSAIVETAVDLFTNIAVSVVDGDTGDETEIPGLRADIPDYSITKSLFNENVLTILGSADIGDTIVLRTLGLNHRRCRERHFVWGNVNSIIKTQLPPPINLNEVRIIPVLLPLVPIGPDNSTLVGSVFTSDPLTPTQPSSATEGRTLEVRITGGNVDFSSPVTVTINGTTASGATNEVLSFEKAEIQDTSEKFKTISSVIVVVKTIITTKNSVSIEVKEAFSITESEGNLIYPVIRFSYKVQTGRELQGTAGSKTVTDNEGFFPELTVDNLLVISSPGSVAGSYTIDAKIDNNNVRLDTSMSATFTDGIYDIFNITLGRSGFQNGWFVLEEAGSSNTPFTLKEGVYEFDYSTYLEVPFDPITNTVAFVGSDMNGDNQVKAVLDELRVLTTMLTDVRVGETLADNEESITTDFTSLNPFKPNNSTTMLLHFDALPLVNSADFWITSDKTFRQSSASVNDNFEKSMVIADKPLIKNNKGLLSTSSEGSVEFWISPKFDTYNDPHERFYFDASSSVVEETVSITNGTVKSLGTISSVESVRLITDTNNIGVNYFSGGTLEDDFKTIKLGRALPAQRTQVKITYVPANLSGDRLSIFKDSEGFIVFNVTASGSDYQVRQPVFWARNTWHRIRATYKFNRSDNKDEIRLFVDGEEHGTIFFGRGLLFGQGAIFGQGFAGTDNSALVSDINFRDPINQIFIGSDFQKTNPAQARFDNLRLSNVARTPTVVAGQDKDINFSSNLDIVSPVVEDAFTTFLLNFDTLKTKIDDLTILRDEAFGIFNFTLNVFDSFDIVVDNPKVQQILEELVLALKPAQSKVTINYI